MGIYAKMLVEELDQALKDFLSPLTELLPEERLRRAQSSRLRLDIGAIVTADNSD